MVYWHTGKLEQLTLHHKGLQCNLVVVWEEVELGAILNDPNPQVSAMPAATPPPPARTVTVGLPTELPDQQNASQRSWVEAVRDLVPDSEGRGSPAPKRKRVTISVPSTQGAQPEPSARKAKGKGRPVSPPLMDGRPVITVDRTKYVATAELRTKLSRRARSKEAIQSHKAGQQSRQC